MKLTRFPQEFGYKVTGNYFPFMKVFITKFLTPRHCQLIIFEEMSTRFSPLFSKLIHSVLWLIFGREECQEYLVYHLFSLHQKLINHFHL